MVNSSSSSCSQTTRESRGWNTVVKWRRMAAGSRGAMDAWGGAACWSSEAGGEEGEGEGREGGGASPSTAWSKRCARRTQHLITKPLDIRELKNAAGKRSKTRKKQCCHATTDANIFPHFPIINATRRHDSARAIMQRANTFRWLHVDGVENQSASITRHQRRWGKRFAAA